MKGGKNNIMKNNNMKFWIIVIIIALIAGFVGAFLGNSITGNVIVDRSSSDATKCIKECQSSCLKLPVKERASCNSKCTSSCKTADVYTKAEVDGMIEGLKPKVVEEVFNKCKPLKGQYRAINEMKGKTGAEICQMQDKGSYCWFGYGGMVKKNTEYFNFDASGIINCETPLADTSEGFMIVQYICCRY